MNYRKPEHFYILLSLILIFSIAFCRSATAQQYDTLEKLDGYHRYNLFTYYLHINQHNPTEIAKINRWIKANGDETEKKLMESYLEMPAYDSLPNAAEVKIKAITKYLDWGKKHNNPYFLAGFYYYLSDLYKKSGQNNKSIEYSLYSLDELKKDPGGKYFKQGWMLYTMGLDFYKYKDYEKAQELSIAAFQFYSQPTNPNRDWFVKGCSNLAGMACLKNGNFILAKKWLDSTIYFSEIQKDTTWVGIATGNLGNIQYLQKKYEAAIPFFEKAIPLCRSSNIAWDNVAAFSTSLAYCYLQTGNKAEVPALLKEADEANKKHYELIRINFLEYFKVAVSYYREEGKIAQALRLTDSVDLYQLKIDEEFDLLKKTQAEARLAYRNKELENLVLTEREKTDLLIRYGLIAGFILILLIGFLFVKRQQLQHQNRKEKLENQMQMAEEELTLAITEIKDISSNIMEKNQLIERYSDEIEKLKKRNTSISDEQSVRLEALQNATKLTAKEWASIKALFEKIHPGFLKLLNSNAAAFTQAETRYLVFSKLEFSQEEIAAMLGAGEEGIKHARLSIKRKLNLEDSEEIKTWLNKLS